MTNFSTDNKNSNPINYTEVRNRIALMRHLEESNFRFELLLDKLSTDDQQMLHDELRRRQEFMQKLHPE